MLVSCFPAVRAALQASLASSLASVSPLISNANVDEKIRLLAETQQLQASEIRDLRLSILRSITASVSFCSSVPFPCRLALKSLTSS